MGAPLGGDDILPLTIDFTVLGDGGLPSSLLGPTWAIASGVAVNTPTLGPTELLTDPGLEATYTAGKCDTLTKGGSPTLAESADVHGGSKAQEFTATIVNDRLNFPVVAGVAGQWYKGSLWGKRSAGTSPNTCFRIFQTGALPVNTEQDEMIGAAYTQQATNIISTTTNAIFVYPAYEVGSAGGNTLLLDDGSLQAITYSSLFALLPATRADVVLKIQPAAFADGTLLGIVLRGDARTAPTNAIIALWRSLARFRATNGEWYLLTKIGSTYALVAGPTNPALAANAWFEVRASGTTITVYYNDVLLTTQTITNAALDGNRFHGILAAGSNKLNRFFVSGN